MTSITDTQWLAGRQEVTEALAKRGLVIVRWKGGLTVRTMAAPKPEPKPAPAPQPKRLAYVEPPRPPARRDASVAMFFGSGA